MNRTKPLLLFIATLLSFYTQAQLTVTAFASRDTICKGESVQLGFAISNPGVITCTSPPAQCSDSEAIDSISIQRITQTGSNVLTWTLYGNFFHSQRAQIIYTAQDLLTQFSGAGYIKSLAFRIGTFNSNATIQNFKINMGCLHPDSTTIINWQENLATVYSSATYTPLPGWNNHNLQQPFYWDGVSNIVIEISSYTPNTSGNLINFMQYTNRPSSVLYARANNINIANDNTIVPTSTNQRLNLRLRMCYADSMPQSPIKWLANDSANIISGSTSANPVIYPTQSGTYRVQITYSGDTLFSNAVEVVVRENVIPDINPHGDTFVCAEDSINVNLSLNNIYSSYMWSTGDTTSTIHVIESGVYSVTVVDTLGCTMSPQIPSGISKVLHPVLSSTQQTYCGQAVVVSLNNSYQQYLWSNGATSATINPTFTSLYSVTVSTANCIDTASVYVNYIDTLPLASFTTYSIPDSNFLYVFAQPDSGVYYRVLRAYTANTGAISSQTSLDDTIKLNCAYYQDKYFQLQVFQGDCLNSTAWFQFPSCTTIGLNDVSSEQLITIIPNPATDYINVNWRGDAKLSDWQIVDAVGKVCIDHISDAANINISALPKGIYILCAKANNTVYRTRFIKQ